MAECANCNRTISDSAVFCPYCGGRRQLVCGACHTVPLPGSVFCHSCGSKLSAGSGSPSPIAPQLTETEESPMDSGECPRCGQVNEPGSHFCLSCGFPLDETSHSEVLSRASPTVVSSNQPGGFWTRFLAFLIDWVLLLAPYFILTAMSGDNTTSLILSYGVVIVYYTLGVGIWSTTIGKRLLGLAVLGPSGYRLGLGRAFARYAAYYPSFFFLGIGFIMIAFRADKRGLHDLICDTVVVKR